MQLFKSKLLPLFILGVFVVATIIPSLSGLSLNAYAATAPNTGARVSFTFDDGLSSALLAANTLKTYGYTGTDYVITHCVGLIANASNNDCAADMTKNYMTWNDIATLHTTYGWEIGSHTVTHPLTAAVDNKTLTDAGLDQEMHNSQLTLQAQGYNAYDFASPYGDYDNRSIAVAAKYYYSHRTFQDLTYSTDPISNAFPYYNPRSSYPYNNYLLSVVPVEGDVSVATVKGYIDQAKASNQWVIFVFHEIKADGDTSYDASLNAYQYRTGDLASIAAYVKAQAIPVVNVEDGLASGTNIMPNSGFNDGIATGWTTDSPTTITADKQSSTILGHGSFDGTITGALNSILLKGSATDTHLFSPKVTVAPGTTYTIKNFINLTSSSGEVDFYIDEYDANGVDLGTGRYVAGITATSSTSDVQVGNVNFLYTPTSPSIASARLQVIVHGVGTVAYVDNLQWLSPNGATTPPVVIPPVTTPKAGDVNGDSVIDALDLSTVLTNWNKTSQTRAQGDLNADGTVDALDLSIILTNWSK
ncbi:MAG: polysaccharide deacetylase [Candidatus Saccharibacteria bacterium]|nr:polysaccharide deacetylase [Candidatus Saccharibacteria bacterium]